MLSIKKVLDKHFINKQNMPQLMKTHFGIEEQLTCALLESSVLSSKMFFDKKEPKLFLPSNKPKNLDITICKPGELTGVKYSSGWNVYVEEGKEVVALRIEQPGKFICAIAQAYNDRFDDLSWWIVANFF